MSDLRITVDGRELAASWTLDSPEVGEAISAALPLEGEATRWGDELYFDCGVDVDGEEGSVEVPVGAVAYWPGGNALCLFWGPTPASVGDRPRAAAPVDVVARIEDASPLADLDGGATVRIERV